MSGALLAEFRLEQDVYRLGQYAPVSVRDQVVRAHYLVDLLRDGGELAVTTRLVILGAGVAGISAALAAARLGVKHVVLIDQAAVPLSLQARCRSRWVDPTQYDWPAGHWLDGQWPVKEPIPRAFTAVTRPFRPLLAAPAQDWSLDFANRLAAWIGQVRPRFSTKVDVWARTTTGRLEIRLQEPGTLKPLAPETADLLLVTLGFGRERSQLPNAANASTPFEGLDFWATDKFQDPDAGVPAIVPGSNLVVSGAGDGALQDFIRLATGLPAAGTVMERAWSSAPDSAPWKVALANAWHWKEQATLALAFAPSPITKCEILSRHHARFATAIDAFAATPEWLNFKSWLDGVTRHRRPGTLKLLLKCTHFGECYPLNQAAALLVIRYLEDISAPSVERQTALMNTTALGGHTCGIGCWGQLHEIALARGTSCSVDDKAVAAWPSHKTSKMNSQGLVVRHGIEPLVHPGLPPQYYLPQQPVPAHLP